MTASAAAPSPGPGAGVLDAGRRRLTAGLVLMVVVLAFEALGVATVLPAAVRELGGLPLYGWAFSAFMLANLVSIPLAGRACDRRGPAPPFVVGAALFVAGLVVAGVAPSMPVLVLGRAIQGLGSGALSSTSYVAIGRGYPPAARPRMLAVISTAWVVPGLVGPAIAGAIAEHATWRLVFLGLAPLFPFGLALVLPALARLAPEPGGGRDASNLGAAVRLALGVACLQAGLGGPRPALGAVLGLGGLALAVHALRTLLPRGTMVARRGLPAAIATMGLFSFAFFGAEAFLPLVLTNLRGQTLTQAGLVLTTATVSWTAGSWIQARMAGKGRRRALVTTGAVFIVLGLVGVTALVTTAVPAWVAPLAWAVDGLGMGLANSTTTLVVLEAAPAGEEGLASAAMQLANVVGVALGTGLGGAAVAAASRSGRSLKGGVTIVDTIMLAAGALTVLASLRLPRRGPAAGSPG